MTPLQLLQTHPGYVDATNPTDQVLYDWLQQNVTVRKDITYAQLIAWASVGGRRRKLYVAFRAYEAAIAANPQPNTHPYTAGQRNDLVLIQDLFIGGGDIAMSKSEVRTIFNSVSGDEAGDIISAEDKNALLTESEKQVSRAVANGIGHFSVTHIAGARA